MSSTDATLAAVLALVVLLVVTVVAVVLWLALRKARTAHQPAAEPAPDVAAALAEIADARQRAAAEQAAIVRSAEADAGAVRRSAETDAEGLRRAAERDAESIRRQAEISASNAALEARRSLDDELRALADESHTLRLDLERREQRIGERESRLDDEARRIEEESRRVQARELDLAAQDSQLRALRAELQDVEAERRLILERVAGLTATEAKAELVHGIENQAKREAAIIVRDIETEARDTGEERARKIVTLAIQRVASDQTAESVVSVVHLPSDDMKGRIIGREGRNIRAFEQVTGVNLIIDDTPEAVLLSSFDPVRRETARLVLEKLVLDGRIHPQRIEEMYERSKGEVEALCLR
ncbi:MAG: ribonucrease, partial [Frankiales bacterium]|nr:ribonucrease [Frankiales bacterium]